MENAEVLNKKKLVLGWQRTMLQLAASSSNWTRNREGGGLL